MNGLKSNMINCTYCNQLINASSINQHQLYCKEKKQTIIEKKKEQKQQIIQVQQKLIKCEYCDNKYKLYTLKEHQKNCIAKQNVEKIYQNENQEYRKYQNEQIACEYCNEKFRRKIFESHINNCQMKEYIQQLQDEEYEKMKRKPKSDMVLIQFKQNQSGDNNCVICMSEFEEGENLDVLKCLHRFHSECIERWMQNKSKCPICKM